MESVATRPTLEWEPPEFAEVDWEPPEFEELQCTSEVTMYMYVARWED
ncbi:pyrroloquinoline quinone precursor peptide PqqA [Saccharopolyspora sp. NPDC000995]|nr:pyrroloquinoline quinone precursor peptide PqqA [Saccharopolyspora pogona]